jgi:AraC-like DNA-binding protein
LRTFILITYSNARVHSRQVALAERNTPPTGREDLPSLPRTLRTGDGSCCTRTSSYSTPFCSILHRTPCALLGDLALELRVSRRTIENSVHMTAGKTFRALRKEILVDRVSTILASNPALPVKELSFAVGFKSASSFSRAIKRACGCCPDELRSRAVRESTNLVSISS